MNYERSIAINYGGSISSKSGTNYQCVELCRPRTSIECMPCKNFDTDSFPIIVDSGCSRTISSHKKDFIPSTLLYRTGPSKSVLGFAGAKTTIEATGTIRWHIIDDSGEQRELLISNSLYAYLPPTPG